MDDIWIRDSTEPFIALFTSLAAAAFSGLSHTWHACQVKRGRLILHLLVSRF